MSRRAGIALAAGALALHLWIGFSFIRSAAPTYDEPVHLSSGYSYLVTGKYVMNIMDHPPFSEMLSAAALLAYKLKNFCAHPYFINASQYHYGDLFLYQNTVPADRMLNTARAFTFLIWTALSAFFMFFFAKKLAGFTAACCSVAVFSFLPVFISNNALVTTDAASAIFYFGAFAFGYAFSVLPPRSVAARGKKSFEVLDNKGQYFYAALAGIPAGLAMASKFSMFVLPPLIIGMWILHNLLEPKLRLSRLIWYSAVFAAVSVFTLALVYKFDLELYYEGLYVTLTKLNAGRSSFALGTYSLNGVWWYFPMALALKTPLAALLFSVAGLWAVFRRSRTVADSASGPRQASVTAFLWILLPAAFYFISALTAKVQIGFRHIMPVMPFLALSAGLGLAFIFEKGGKILKWLVLLLALSWFWLLFVTHPFYLSYFNELAGGPENGWKYMADSNYDWGQDLKPLGAGLKKLGNPPVVLSYFGVARPEYYGIKYILLPGGLSNVELDGTGEDICALKRPLLAVSATNLQGVYFPDHDVFGWLKQRKPLFTAGYSIFVYDLTGDKEGLEKLSDMFDRQGLNREAECIRSRG
ncbi:MAG: hypothetical protein NTX59_13150 [Elusimicrobia bacterium]|nr:hypothetical protein [Elusimicrobiota bacterium]